MQGDRERSISDWLQFVLFSVFLSLLSAGTLLWLQASQCPSQQGVGITPQSRCAVSCFKSSLHTSRLHWKWKQIEYSVAAFFCPTEQRCMTVRRSTRTKALLLETKNCLNSFRKGANCTAAVY